MYSVNKKIEHLKKLGFYGDLSEIVKLYNGEPFNPNDKNIVKLIDESKKYCVEYSNVLGSLNNAKDRDELNKMNKRKNELIEIIFPGHGGAFANVCDGVYATIGMVDFDGVANINKNVVFAPFTKVYCGNYTLFGSNIQVGNDDFVTNGLQHVGKIVIEGDDWICSKVRIENDVVIGARSVVALGATVRNGHNIERSVLAVGDPAKTKKVITRDYKSSQNNTFNRSKEEIDYIVKMVKKLGIDGDFTEYIRSLRGENYNCFARTVLEIANLSHNLSYEYNNPFTSETRREKIRNILFPIMGDNVEIEKGLFVDILGQATLGKNVSVGENAFFAGNVIVDDDVELGKNVVSSAIGHDVYYEDRHLRDFNDLFGEPCTVGKIEIKKGVRVGNNVGISPGAVIKDDVKDNTIVLKNGKSFEINEQFGPGR